AALLRTRSVSWRPGSAFRTFEPTNPVPPVMKIELFVVMCGVSLRWLARPAGSFRPGAHRIIGRGAQTCGPAFSATQEHQSRVANATDLAHVSMSSIATDSFGACAPLT